MKVSAAITSKVNHHLVSVQTDDSPKEISIAPKAGGFGSSVNGAELLLLSLATCFCNDIYREAAARNITVTGVEVSFTADFGAPGEPGSNFQYHARVISAAPASEIEELIKDTDRIAEIHNTLRKGVNVTLTL